VLYYFLLGIKHGIIKLMNQRFLFKVIVVGGLLIAVLHSIAIMFVLYWMVWWTDLLMHFLGGLWIAFLTAWVIVVLKKSVSIRQISTILVASVLVVGVSWEVFEVLTHSTGTTNATFWSDTVSDLCMDVLGALTAIFIIRNKRIA